MSKYIIYDIPVEVRSKVVYYLRKEGYTFNDNITSEYLAYREAQKEEHLTYDLIRSADPDTYNLPKFKDYTKVSWIEYFKIKGIEYNFTVNGTKYSSEEAADRFNTMKTKDIILPPKRQFTMNTIAKNIEEQGCIAIKIENNAPEILDYFKSLGYNTGSRPGKVSEGVYYTIHNSVYYTSYFRNVSIIKYEYTLEEVKVSLIGIKHNTEEDSKNKMVQPNDENTLNTILETIENLGDIAIRSTNDNAERVLKYLISLGYKNSNHLLGNGSATSVYHTENSVICCTRTREGADYLRGLPIFTLECIKSALKNRITNNKKKMDSIPEIFKKQNSIAIIVKNRNDKDILKYLDSLGYINPGYSGDASEGAVYYTVKNLIDCRSETDWKKGNQEAFTLEECKTITENIVKDTAVQNPCSEILMNTSGVSSIKIEKEVKTNNTNKKEKIMKTNVMTSIVEKFKSQFMPTKVDNLRLSFNGDICIPSGEGDYIAIDKDNNLISYLEAMTLSVPIYSINKPVAQVNTGDIIRHSKYSYAKVVGKTARGQLKLLTFNGTGSTKNTVTCALTGMNSVPTIVNIFGNMSMGDTNGINPMMMMAMGEGDVDIKEMLMLSMMSGQNMGNSGMNPMMMLILMSEKGESSSMMETIMMMQLMGGQNPMASMFGNPTTK